MSQNYRTGSNSWTEQPSFPLRAAEELSIETKAKLRLVSPCCRADPFHPTPLRLAPAAGLTQSTPHQGARAGCNSSRWRLVTSNITAHVTPAASGPQHEASCTPPPPVCLPLTLEVSGSQASDSSREHIEAQSEFQASCCHPGLQLRLSISLYLSSLLCEMAVKSPTSQSNS